MKLPDGPTLRLEETESTQKVAARALLEGLAPGVVVARRQTKGKGRFDRVWVAEPGSSLTATLVFSAYADHKQPWLIGMSLAAAAAAVLHCQVQWPNDLTLGGKKLGGVLTELAPGHKGSLIPLVGIGINLGPMEFPSDLADRATTLFEHRGETLDPETALNRLLERLRSMPEPEAWQSLAPVWKLFDDTPGKAYKLPGGAEAIAIGVGPAGELLCSVDGESTTVMAADAVFGSPAGAASSIR